MAECRRASRGASSRSAISTGSTSATRRWSGARSRGPPERRPAIVATFDPHPVQLLHARRAAVPPDHARPARGAVRPRGGRRDAGVRVRRRAGARWTRRSSSPRCSAKQIGAAGVVTGEDFTFGKGRRGDVALLEALGRELGIGAEAVAQVLSTASASRRAASARRSKPATAKPPTRLLTRDFAIEGVVQHGDKRGRELGYPTANLDLGKYLRPALRHLRRARELDDGSEHPGVASLGIRPTFDPPQELLEAYSSTSTATCTAARSRSRCTPSSARRRSSTTSTRSPPQMREDEAAAGAARYRSADTQSAGSRVHSAAKRGAVTEASDADVRSDGLHICPRPAKSRARNGRRPRHSQARLPRHRLPAEDRLPDEGRPAAEGAGDPRALAGEDLYGQIRARRARAARSSSSTTARPTPTATSTSATRSTTCSRTWSCARRPCSARTRPTCPAGTATACRSSGRSRSSTARRSSTRTRCRSRSSAPSAAPMPSIGSTCSASN